MIHFELLRDKGIAILSPDGPLEKADFEKIAEEIDPYIAANGSLTGVMVVVNAFPGWESFSALVSHLRFVKGHHRKIGRIAAVTDSELLKIMPHIAKHFVTAEIRQFPSDEKAQALAWLEGGQSPVGG
jgi:hypothetical protein